jgi:MoxR-like ATPase
MSFTIPKSQSILEKIVGGYHKIEPCVVVAAALRHNIYLEALHGVGKTTLGKVLGRTIDETGRGFRYYSADKAGLIDIGGFPNMAGAEKTGKFEFIKTDRSIFGANIVVIDELARANTERMNYWMEVLEERSFQGIPCDYTLAIATGNPATYKNSRKLDAALKDRFLFWLPCENYETVEPSDVRSMIALNRRSSGRNLQSIATELDEVIVKTRQEYEILIEDDDLFEQMSTFVSAFIPHIKDKVMGSTELRENLAAWTSPRTFAAQLPIAIVGLCAYFRVMGYPNPLQLAGEYAVRYNIQTHHSEAGPEFIDICNKAWRQLSGMLVEGINTPEGKLHCGFASALSARQKVDFLQREIANVCQHLDDLEITRITGDTLNQATSEDISQVGPLWKVLKDHPKTKHVADQVRGFVITDIARVLMHGSYPDCTDSKMQMMASKYAKADRLNSLQVSEILATNNDD